MQSVHRVVRRASRRLFASLLLHRLAVTTLLAIIVLLLVRISLWLVSVPLDPAAAVAIAAALAVAGALVWAMLTRPRGVAVARRVDDAAQLRESLSTAWTIERLDDPWSAAVRADADRRAAGLDVRAALPLRLSRLWQAPPIAAIAVVIIWALLPTRGPDLLGWLERSQEIAQAEAELEEARTAVEVAENIAQQVAERTGQQPTEPLELGDPQLGNPEGLRLAALERLTASEQALREEVENGEAARRLEAVKQELSRLKQPGPGPATEFARELARGDFKAAREQLEELQKKVESGELDAQSKQQLSQQLQGMQKQLEQIAQQKSGLEQALQQAGMSAEQAQRAAADPSQLQQAIEQLQNLSPQQQQQLLQQAQQMAQAAQSAQNMSQAMGQMAQQMSQGQQGGQQQQGGQSPQGNMAGMLSDLEMMQNEWQQSAQLLSQAQGQIAAMGQGGQGGGMQGMGGGDPMWGPTSAWREGESSRTGPGSGGPGRGSGASPDAEAADYQRTRERTQTRLGQGPIVGQRLVYGDQIIGETRAQFSAAVEAAASGVAEAVEENVVPIEYQESLQAYFGRLQRQAEVVEGQAPPVSPEPTPAVPSEGGGS
ncbi:MAG: hypothetical protein AAFX79_04055 [Planctomycetota bacterium]